MHTPEDGSDGGKRLSSKRRQGDALDWGKAKPPMHDPL